MAQRSDCHILGISAFYHDSAACLLRDGEIIAAASEERFSRSKGDASFPAGAVQFCLREGGLEVQELDYVGFYDKPLRKCDRILETYLSVAPRGFSSFLKAGPLWMKEKLYTDQRIRDALGWDGDVLYSEHHESHAASAFYPSPFDEAAILTIDGVGEWATASMGVGDDNEIRLLKELHWPDSLGLLYSAFTYHTGFRANSGEYKLMGLAPYGEPRYVDAILSEVVDLRADGSFRLNQEFFDYLTGLTMTSRTFDRLFGGPPRKPDSPITRREMDLARSVQEVCEEAMLRMARALHRETGRARLCMAGGVALNCVGNGRIVREGPYEDIWIQPAAGDAGGALGVAMLVWHRHLSEARRAGPGDAMKGACLGPSFSSREIRSTLDADGAVYERLPRAELIDRTARALAEEKVVGWFQGRMEFGPRALGSRSILGDPRSPRMQAQMNRKIKLRESFRPFAPSVLREGVGEYFEMDCESPYMLLVAPVREERRIAVAEEHDGRPGVEKVKLSRSDIPAVTHVDYTARIQTVAPETNRDYYDLIRRFEELTGCGVVVNTSFNVRGEPIVCTPEEAYRCFMRTEMDHLVAGSFFLEKERQPERVEEDDSESRVRARLPPSEGRRFGLTVGLAFLGLAGVLWWRAGGTVGLVAGGPGGLLLLAGLVAPDRLGPVRRAWMALGHAISRVTTPIVLAVLYFAVLTPIGLLRRLAAGNPLIHRPEAGTYWKRRAERARRGNLERQF